MEFRNIKTFLCIAEMNSFSKAAEKLGYSQSAVSQAVRALVLIQDGISADKTIARKTGARGLRSIMEETMMDLMFTIPSDDTIESCTITEEAVDGSGVPMIDRK